MRVSANNIQLCAIGQYHPNVNVHKAEDLATSQPHIMMVLARALNHFISAPVLALSLSVYNPTLFDATFLFVIDYYDGITLTHHLEHRLNLPALSTNNLNVYDDVYPIFEDAPASTFVYFLGSGLSTFNYNLNVWSN